ncbi:hypothetical protein D0466_20315 [Peribacillus glennii]|uniref:Uncharacterized protein n=1 Tax=Peribacillus glennii TaxID=2303991 RepID=A0A372L7Z8_9BACI|nr:hypothetical protein D0466_20315 [Peribacillus glennii]
MYIVEFIAKHIESTFRRKTFSSPRTMHDFICCFELKEGKAYSFYDSKLERFTAYFCRLSYFSKNEDFGFKLFFDIASSTFNNEKDSQNQVF